MDTKSKESALRGVCHFFSETGTEGGYWAFQDEIFITKNVVKPYCKKCGLYLEHQDGPLQVTRVTPLDQALLEQYFPSCKEGEHERAVGDEWSYEGLHVLEDGDHLTIFSPNDSSSVVWSGTVSLKPRKDFNEHVFGWRVHFTPKNIDKEIWAEFFFNQYPAELIKNRK